MKYVILVPDGMADLPLEELDGRTCLEAAKTPNMDIMARTGIVGTVKNIPKGMTPASDVANLSILGYDPAKYYCGRGPLEAANLGVELGANDVAFRFNTVTVSEGKMADYSAGHITNPETREIVDLLNKMLSTDKIHFYQGTSYRNLAVVKCDSAEEADRFAAVQCHAPHDILDKQIAKYLPGDDFLKDIMAKSADVLFDTDINKVRVDLKQNPANMIWFWGQGKKPSIPTYREKFDMTGGIISAVDLIKGIGKILELEVVNVPGATGYYDTNYEGKADAALKILDKHDMVFVHVEAPDEAGHNGDILAKITAIENFDSKIIGRIMKAMDGKDHRMVVLPDHPTPVKKRTHTSDPVPFAMCGSGIKADDVLFFSERAAKSGSVEIKAGSELMKLLLKQ